MTRPDAPLVSVVVPVYNTEAYLDEALESVRSQTLPELEIVCIDDASTDGSLPTLRRHAAADERVRVVERSANAGPGAARNLALQRVRGRYVYFFDSDDVLQRDALARLVAAAERDALDAVFFNARPLIDASMDPELLSRYRRQYRRVQTYPSVTPGSELLARMNDHGEWKPSPCLFLTRRSLLERAELRFTEGVLHEDNGFTMRLMLAAERVGYDGAEYFVRRVRAASITTSPVSGRHVRSLIVAAGELLLAARDQGLGVAPPPGVTRALAMQAEAIFQDAVRKYRLVSADDPGALLDWAPVQPEHLVLRDRVLDLAGRADLETALATSAAEADALRAEADALRADNDAFRRSRVLRASRRLRAALRRLRPRPR